MKAAALAHEINVGQALVRGACPICCVLKEFQSALAEKVQVHADLHLCNFHTWLLARSAQDQLVTSKRRFAPVGGEIERFSRQFGKREFRSERTLGDIRNADARGQSTMPVQGKQSYRDCDGRDGDQNLLSQCVVLDRGRVASPTLPWQPDSPYPPSSRRNCQEYKAPSRW
jgi:hypothetical protein